MQLTKLRKWLVLLNVSISIFMATLDGSIVNIALPIIKTYLSVNISSIQWVVTSYLLAISVLLLIWGKLADLYGKKKVFLFGFIIFSVGSGLCGISSSLEMLVISRIIQAVGASSMMALSQGIVTSIFDHGERGMALGITGTTVAIGSLTGPVLGGILVHNFGWHSIFLVNIPIGIIGTIFTILVIPEINEVSENKKFDFLGSILFIAAILLMFMGLLFLQDAKISGIVFIIMFISALVVLGLFLMRQRRIDTPLIDVGLFKIKVFSLGLTTAFLSFIALFSTIYFMPFYLENVMKFDALKAGLLMSAYPFTMAIIAPFSGALSDKITYKPLTIIGLAINALVLLVVSTLNRTSSIVEIVILMAMLGAGVGIFQSPNNSSVMGSVPRNQLGAAGGINALFRNIGMVSGTTLSVLLFTFTTNINLNSVSKDNGGFNPEVFLKGFHIVFIFAACSCAVALVLSLLRLSEKKMALVKLRD
ncbi:MAG: MFS transporter [Bacillota bacterium]|nr:MFS transporter [Bacillota bacterium]